MYLQKNPGINITKYEIAELTRRPYLKPSEPVTALYKNSGFHLFPENTKYGGKEFPMAFPPAMIVTVDYLPSTWHSNQQVDGGNYEAEAEESCKTSETINSKGTISIQSKT
jgi:hypothetical protein